MNKKIINWQRVFTIVTLLLTFWVYKNWFISPVNISTDLNFVDYSELKNHYENGPTVWYPHIANGFGTHALYPLIYFWFFYLFLRATFFIENPFILHKIIFLIPVLLTGIGSCWYFTKVFLKKNTASFVFSFIFLLNPYILMVASGGQAGVATAYMLTPLAIAFFYQIIKRIQNEEYISRYHQLRDYLIFTIIIVVLSMHDSRILYIDIFALVLLATGIIISNRELVKKLGQFCILGIVLITGFVGFHAIWIVPSLLNTSIQLPTGYGSDASLQFLSFTRLAHAITLTHPNYPENIFGQVKEISGFAFVLPILAFWQLRKKEKKVIFFAILSLGGIFLSKGANEPLEQFYIWAYKSLPLMNLYRDSTKFFVLIAVGFSFLISLTLDELISYKILQKYKTAILSVFIGFVIILWNPTFIDRIKGTLAYRQYPEGFKNVETYFKKENNYGRVLWVPYKEKFGFSNPQHPSVNLTEMIRGGQCLPTFCIPEKTWPDNYVFTREDISKEIHENIQIFQQGSSEKVFNKLAINYIVIPPDIDQEIFIYDRKYYQTIKNEYINLLDQVSWLNKTYDTEGFVIYKTAWPGDLISPSQYSEETPTKYKVFLTGEEQGIYFSQKFDENWILKDSTYTIKSSEDQQINYFAVNNQSGEYKLEYQPQKYADTGFQISTVTIFILTLLTGFTALKSVKV